MSLITPMCLAEPTNADEGASFKVLALTKKREYDTIQKDFFFFIRLMTTKNM